MAEMGIKAPTLLCVMGKPPTLENWRTFKQQLKLYLTATGVPDEEGQRSRRIAILLTLGGAELLRIYNTFGLADAHEETLDQILVRFDGHFQPRANVLIERYKFRSAKQEQEESIDAYLVRITGLVQQCGFVEATRPEHLRDQLVYGCYDERLREKLFRNAELTFDQAKADARAHEAAREQMMIFNQANRTSTTNERSREASSKETVAQVRNYSHSAPRNNKGGCFRCGRNHMANKCPFKEAECHLCHKKGHIKPMCYQNPLNTAKRENVKAVESEEGANATSTVQMEQRGYDEEEHNPVYLTSEVVAKTSSNNQNCAVTVKCLVNGISLTMEVDTGCSTTLIPDFVYDTKFKHVMLQPSSKQFYSFTGEKVACKGRMCAEVQYGGWKGNLWLYVVSGARSILLGRDWMRELPLEWSSVLHTGGIGKVSGGEGPTLDDVLANHTELFQPGLGTLQNITAKLYLKEGSKPVREKAYRIPLALRETVESEIDRLVKEGIIEPVEYSEWASGVVPVLKENGKIRLCGNFKPTINPCLQDLSPPQIHMDDILAKLSGSKFFTTLDLSAAYNQMEVDSSYRDLLTIATSKGLFRFRRLAFGVKTAPAIWQHAMEQVLNGLPGVQVYYDDILVTGISEQEHSANLDAVMHRLKQFGLRLNKRKCKFMLTSVQYLGHIIDEVGVRPVPSKVESIVDTEAPKDEKKLRSYLGMLGFYRKFIPKFSEVVKPLTNLLKKDTPSQTWGLEAQQAFDKSKQLLQSSEFLVHFDHTKSVVLTCDASAEGVAAVLSHRFEDGQDRPIQFASRVLSKAEQGYPQLEREALAIVFGVERFYNFLFGRKFTLVTDNQPLSVIFGPKVGIPVMAAERLQRWAVKLSGFNYEVECCKSEQNPADFLSRYPAESTSANQVDKEQVAYVFSTSCLPVTSAQVSTATRNDPILAEVMIRLQEGSLDKATSDEMRAFVTKSKELSVMSGVLMWGLRIVVPMKLRHKMLEELHEGHLGISKMKALGRSFIWWPGFDRDVELCCKACPVCQSLGGDPPTVVVHPWLPSKKPLQRVHIDYAGPIKGYMLLIIVDAYSKWPEVYLTHSTTSTSTIGLLVNYMSRYGLIREIVSDNGPQFVSQEFQQFLQANHVKHTRSAPYHPATNGQAERFVKTIKQGLQLCMGENPTDSVQFCLDRFLLAYRNCPHVGTGESPALRFLGRELTTRLNLIRPRFEDQAVAKRGGRRPVMFQVGELVWVRSYVGSTKWLKGVVRACEGQLLYRVEVMDKIWKRHFDQLKPRLQNAQCEESDALFEEFDSSLPSIAASEGVQAHDDSGGRLAASRSPGVASGGGDGNAQVPQLPASPVVPGSQPVQPLRQSSRLRQPPKRLIEEL